jgi:integrase/recombinase XerD
MFILKAPVDFKKINNQYLTTSQIEEILSVVKKNPVHRLAIKLLFSTGLYISELINLRISDIDPQQSTLEIKMNRKLNGRTIYIPKNLCMDLLRHGQSIHTNGYIFQGRDGKLCDRTIQKIFVKVNKLNIGSNLTIERIRNAIALQLLIWGHNMHEIAYFLGHKEVRSTRRKIQKFMEHDTARIALFKVIFAKYA